MDDKDFGTMWSRIYQFAYRSAPEERPLGLLQVIRELEKFLVSKDLDVGINRGLQKLTVDKIIDGSQLVVLQQANALRNDFIHADKAVKAGKPDPREKVDAADINAAVRVVHEFLFVQHFAPPPPPPSRTTTNASWAPARTAGASESPAAHQAPTQQGTHPSPSESLPPSHPEDIISSTSRSPPPSLGALDTMTAQLRELLAIRTDQHPEVRRLLSNRSDMTAAALARCSALQAEHEEALRAYRPDSREAEQARAALQELSPWAAEILRYRHDDNLYRLLSPGTILWRRPLRFREVDRDDAEPIWGATSDYGQIVCPDYSVDGSFLSSFSTQSGDRLHGVTQCSVALLTVTDGDRVFRLVESEVPAGSQSAPRVADLALECVDVRSAQQRWSCRLGKTAHLRRSVVALGGRVLVFAFDASLSDKIVGISAVDATTGVLAWSLSESADPSVSSTDPLVVTCRSHFGTKLIGLDVRSGRRTWTRRFRGFVSLREASASVYVYSCGSKLFSSKKFHFLTCLDLQTGRTRWAIPVDQVPRAIVPAKSGKYLLVKTDRPAPTAPEKEHHDDGGEFVYTMLDGLTGRSHWRLDEHLLNEYFGRSQDQEGDLGHSVDPIPSDSRTSSSRGKEPPRWTVRSTSDRLRAGLSCLNLSLQYLTYGAIVDEPFFDHNDRLFVMRATPKNGSLHCFEASTGEWHWTAGSLSSQDSALIVTVAGNQVYVYDDDGRIVAIDAAAAKLIWQSEEKWPPVRRMVILNNKLVVAGAATGENDVDDPPDQARSTDGVIACIWTGEPSSADRRTIWRHERPIGKPVRRVRLSERTKQLLNRASKSS